MKKVKKLTGVLAMLGASTFLCAGALGYWKITGSSGNILTMSSFKNQIEEKYQVPDHVDPGKTVDKIVNVKNTGTVDSVIRVKIKKCLEKSEKTELLCRMTAWIRR